MVGDLSQAHTGPRLGQTGTQREGSLGWGDGQARLLEVDVGTDQHVVEQEDPALLGLDQLPAVTIHGLRQRLTQEQLPLARGQKLEEQTEQDQRQHCSRAAPQTSLCQIPRAVLPRPKGTTAGRGGVRQTTPSTPGDQRH